MQPSLRGLISLSYGLSRIRGDETSRFWRGKHLFESYGLSRIRGDETLDPPRGGHPPESYGLSRIRGDETPPCMSGYRYG